MTARITVNLNKLERQALDDLARQEYRDPRLQAALFIRRGLEAAGYLQTGAAAIEIESPDQQAEGAAAMPEGGTHDHV